MENCSSNGSLDSNSAGNGCTLPFPINCLAIKLISSPLIKLTFSNTDSQYFVFIFLCEGAPFRPGAHLYKAGAITTQILLIEKGTADVYTATDLCNMAKVWCSSDHYCLTCDSDFSVYDTDMCDQKSIEQPLCVSMPFLYQVDTIVLNSDLTVTKP
jgi:hypothetical protein